MTEARPPRRRQARGERRMAQILDAAAEVLGESGFETATTNAIAARAGISPGSLYQFFPNKEAVVEALADRFADQLSAARSAAFTPEVHHVPLREMIDRVADPMIAFNLANPGFKALFARPDAPPQLAAATRRLGETVHDRLEQVIADRSPHLTAEERTRCVQVGVQLFRAMIPLVTAATGGERDALIAELKKVLVRYLEPALGP